MLFRLIGESYLIENIQVSDRVSACFNRLESGAQHRFLLKLFIGMTNNEIVYLIHVGLIFISIPQPLMDGLIDVILLEIGRPGKKIGRSASVSVTIVGISGPGKYVGVLVMISGWQPSLYASMVCRTNSFIVL